MFLKRDDIDLFVRFFGSGSTAFVAHGGWVGSGELWVPILELLSRNWRAMSYDHRGTGATVDRSPVITFDRLLDDLFRVLDALDVDTCVLAGESAGASVVLEAARRDPTRFDGLVVVDGRYRGGRSEAAERLVQGCKADFPATMDVFIDACFPEEDCEAERRWGKQIVNRSSGPAAVELMASADEATVEYHLSEITLPTLIIHGRHDAIVPVDAAEDLARKLPNSSLVVLEDAGHVPIMSRPYATAQAIETFFAYADAG